MKCCNPDKPETNFAVDDSLEDLICYCFKHSKKELFEAIKKGSQHNIVEDIKAKIKDSGCFCETANPSGKCCLPEIYNFSKKCKNLKT